MHINQTWEPCWWTNNDNNNNIGWQWANSNESNTLTSAEEWSDPLLLQLNSLVDLCAANQSAQKQHKHKHTFSNFSTHPSHTWFTYIGTSRIARRDPLFNVHYGCCDSIFCHIFFFSRFFYCHLFCSQSRDFSAAVWINVCNRKHVWWQLFFFMPRRRATFLYFVFVDLPLIVHNQYLKLAFIRCDLLSMRGLVPCNSRTESVL